MSLWDGLELPPVDPETKARYEMLGQDLYGTFDVEELFREASKGLSERSNRFEKVEADLALDMSKHEIKSEKQSGSPAN